MAKIVLLKPNILINSVDLSDHIVQVTIDEKFADIDATAFTQGSKTRLAGLGDHSFKADFQQDFAASSVEATIYPLIGTTPTVVVRPTGMTTSTTNPSYTFTPLVLEWMPISGQVGALLVSTQTWPISGDVVKALS